MEETCQQFREHWLERALDGALEPDGHALSCGPCGDWTRTRSHQVRALLALPRTSPPERLGVAVADELSRTRVGRALASMPRLAAPPQLEALVAQELREAVAAPALGAGRESAHASAGTLDYALVPPVLERLVDEELASPEAHRTARFVGNLERKAAPRRLDVLVSALLRPRRLVRVGALVGAAAAVLFAWSVFSRPERAVPRLERVRVHDLSQLDSFARGYVEALAGGVLPEGPQ